MGKYEISRYSSEEIYQLLKEEILSLHLLPGQKVSENELAHRFNISRTPVHSAFMRLKSDGLINIFPQRGTFVSLIDVEAIQQVIFLRIHLERAIYTEAAEKWTPEFLAELDENLQQQQAEVDKGPSANAFFAVSNQYHKLFYEFTKKQKLWTTMEAMQFDYIRYRKLSYSLPSTCIRKLQEHRQLRELVQARDYDGIYRFVPAHISGEIESLPQESGAFHDFFCE